MCELGTYRPPEIGTEPSLEAITNHRWRVRVEKQLHASVWKSAWQERRFDSAGICDIALLDVFANASDRELKSAVGAIDAMPIDLLRFRSLCKYFVTVNSALLQGGLNMGRFDVIACADLETLPAAVALKQQWGCHLVFDSHEYWPHSFPDFRAWEIDVWSRLEARLVAFADQRVTVSATLAAQLTAEYGLPFESVPNAAPLADAPGAWFRERDEEKRSRRELPAEADPRTTFLFQGGFAVGRGIEMLIDAWADVEESAVLVLRGPDNAFKAEMVALAQANGTLDRTVFFPPAVGEAELIAVAQEADVGVIPYDPRLYGNKFACPNKLSQYMASGLAILSNAIEYVADIVESNALGKTVPFHDRAGLIRIVEELARDRQQREAFGRNARAYFETAFNWDVVSHDVVKTIRTQIAFDNPSPEPIQFDWIDQDASMRGKMSDEAQVSGFMQRTWHLIPRQLRYRIAAHLPIIGILRQNALR